ncbi:alpha/beta fold hydrolase [Crocinitomix catalasitica]|uniref:alpha/beta fold hydrolase n=1 Tax=Crocinitomix catalasitica TaxID=184607 RepID=UPI0006853134|nr:alpha/beta hydrolase [Crocinitomix catalasitica]
MTLRSLFIFIFLGYFASLKAQDNPVIYLIPGQGSDARIFKNINIDSLYDVRNIIYSVPEENMSMNTFARELAKQIDTNQRFILIGVSLGGMLATEMNSFLKPEKTILISSAKTKKELPWRYRFQNKLPVYKIMSSKMSKKGALFMQPIVEPDRNKEKETCVAMLEAKDPLFLSRTIAMIMTWQRTSFEGDILHIHGSNDHTIPMRNVNADYKIKKGSHMMTLTRADEIEVLISKILSK